MQPRPTESSQSSSDQSTPLEPSTSTQHGQQHLSASSGPAASMLSGTGTGAAAAAAAAADNFTVHSGATRLERHASEPGRHDESSRGDTSELNSSSRKSDRRTPSPVDRIIEHERASPKYGSSRDTSTGFRVISRSKNAPAPRLSLHDLPAEVLTHVCSYLPADSFSAMSLVSRKIRSAVTEQHAWRMAFARYFPGHESLTERVVATARRDRAGEELLVSEKRFFTRLTALASWRSEYIIRTRMLRSLSKGSPSDVDQLTARIASRSNSKATRLSQVDYNIDMDCPVTIVAGSFDIKNNRPHVRLVHGSHEDCRATLSNPLESKHIPWSFAPAFSQFYERFPGVEMYGLGAGEIVGSFNSMDVSPLFGILIGDGSPGGRIYHRHLDEQRGTFLARSVNDRAPELGIPKVDPVRESMTAVWLSKTRNIPVMTNGLVGALVGTSTGTVMACSLGTDGTSAVRTGLANISARWTLSPGVPIIAFGVDESFSARRRQQNRIWAFALNALGEIFYLNEFPDAAQAAAIVASTSARRDPSDWEVNSAAWQLGRTAYWNLVESTRRKPKPDPFGEAEVDGSYSPRSSAQSHGLGEEQLAAECKEIEAFMSKPPIHFRNLCEGWDMQRRLEVDFTGDDGHGAGEAVFVVSCGLQEDQGASIQRYTRLLIEDAVRVEENVDDRNQLQSQAAVTPLPKSSLFGGPQVPEEPAPTNVWNVTKPENVRRLSRTSSEGTIPEERFEVWRQSELSFGGLKAVQISASARDRSTYAEFTMDEDPLLSLNPVSNTWSPTASPIGRMTVPGSPSDVPGQRARLFCIGTKIGTIVVWNMRAPVSSSTELINEIEPVCVIHTESPGISSLAMSALYLVHGGNDGLVQSWDPLASTKDPIRTLHSKFTQRARRDLRQNEARPQGVGVNFYAAGAICLDPDPKVLRGVVGIGNRLRYWSYSSSAADSYRGSKRRSQRDRRSSNQGGADPKVTRTGRGALADYIANEQADLERSKRAQKKEADRFNARYGGNLLGAGATDDEIMAYATMISEESYASDNARRYSVTSSSASSFASSPPNYPPSVPEEEEHGSSSGPEKAVDAEIAKALQNEDEQLAEALRRSLQESGNAQDIPTSDFEPTFDAQSSTFALSSSPHAGSATGSEDLGFVVKYAKNRRGRRGASPTGKSGAPSAGNTESPASFGGATSARHAGAGGDGGHGNKGQAEADDLEYALQLSLAEEQSRQELEREFPGLRQEPTPPTMSGAGSPKGKGKGREQ